MSLCAECLQQLCQWTDREGEKPLFLSSINWHDALRTIDRESRDRDSEPPRDSLDVVEDFSQEYPDVHVAHSVWTERFVRAIISCSPRVQFLARADLCELTEWRGTS